MRSEGGSVMEPQVQWVTAAPLWDTTDRYEMRRPALLRFETDTFMEELAVMLATAPATLRGRVARRLSYQAPPIGAPFDWMAPPPPVLKLYQPAHGHFNLLGAQLVCRVPGLPDRFVDPGQQERVSFVLRRVIGDGRELAWASAPDAPTGPKRWRLVAEDQGNAVVRHEERYPLFPISFDDGGHRRRMLAGLIPTASQEAHPIPAIPPGEVVTVAGEPDPRHEELSQRVIEVLAGLTTPGNTVAEAQAVDTSLFLLLDLADLLQQHAPVVWQAVFEQQSAPASVATGNTLYQLLKRWFIPSSATSQSGTSWASVLRAVWLQRERLLRDGTTQPVLRWDLRATLEHRTPPEAPRPLLTALRPASPPVQFDDVLSAFDTVLGAAVRGALQPPPTTTSATVLGSKLDRVEGEDGGAAALYVLRCIYERPACEPWKPAVVSDPTEPFTLAPFFDVDAPARPIRIAMPTDTSLAGLRKYQRNVSFAMSNKLRQQMDCASDLKKVMDGKLQCGAGFDLGFICSFSIPIITICALIVLMIFIYLLNIVFWWLPFLRICLPIPKPSES
jgi:hypothetical protein